MRLKKSYFLAVAVSAVLLLTAGCATLSLQPPETQLRNRVTEFLQAKIDQNLAVMYDYHEPSFKKKVSKEQFMGRQGNLTFKSFDIKSIEISPTGKEATVKVAFGIEFQGFSFDNAPQTQQWVMERGQWYLKGYPQKKINPME